MTFFQDASYSHRFLASHPGFTLAAGLMLALGVGGNIAVFSVFQAVLIRPLPLREPERLVAVFETQPALGVSSDACSQRTFHALAERRDVFAGITAVYSRVANLGGLEEAQTVTSWQTDAQFLETLGMKLEAGRGFRPEETRPGSPAPVAVLGQRLWRRSFGADPGVVGRIIRIDNAPVSVIGVMAPTEDWLDADLLLPFQPLVTDFQYRRMLAVIGRLNRGLALDRASRMLRETAEAVAREYPETHGGWTVAVVPFGDRVVGADTRRILLLMGIAVLVVLVIACANLVNLLLARAVGRRRELAIHNTLGAGRLRLARRLVTESVMLAVLSGGAGLLLAMWFVDLLRAAGAGEIPRIDAAELGWQTLAFAAALSLAAGLVTGMLPALLASGVKINAALKEGSGAGPCSPERQWVRNVLVVVEVALALALLTGAGLLGRSILRALRVDPGLQIKDRVAITVNLPVRHYETGTHVVDFWRALLVRVRAVDGVRDAAATSDRWLLAGRRSVQYDVEGGDEVNRRVPAAELRTVTPGYFQILGIPLIAGRVFDDGDRGTPDALPDQQRPFVVVVSKTLAARQWPGESAVGKRIRPVVGNQMSYWSTIIGVVDDIRQSALTESPVPTVYLPEFQYAWRRLFLLVHTTGDLTSVMPGVRAAIHAMDPALPVDDIVPLEALRHRSIALARSVTFILAGFAIIAVTLAAFGIYSLLAYTVACRTQEFGVRIALGADRRDILRLVLWKGLRLTLAGIAAGAVLALGLGTWLRSMLFEVSPADPATLAGVAAFLLLVALVACLVPAWRALRIDPAGALRSE